MSKLSRRTKHSFGRFAASLFVFGFYEAAHIFPAMPASASKDQVIFLHFGSFKGYRNRPKAFTAEDIIENLPLRPFRYLLPAFCRRRCKRVRGLDGLYHFIFSLKLYISGGKNQSEAIAKR